MTDPSLDLIAANYSEFLAKKACLAPDVGFDPGDELHSALKPFQRDIVRWALRRGRAALFEGTGLGKTIQELVWAQNVRQNMQGEVLIFTPLAVAEQTVQEAEKFGIGSVSYALTGAMARTPIVVTNYERRDRFDLSSFAGVVLDESGIIKDADGKTRSELTEACMGIPYKLCATATPAPNDWTELGTHAEFLDVMGEKEMLSMFFVHDGSVRASDGDEWRLKRHAEADFWRWVASWAVMIRHPRDIGYDDAGYDLPPLNLHQVVVRSEYGTAAGTLFPMEARTIKEKLAVKRASIDDRVRAVANLVAERPDDPWLIWCHLNVESDALVKAITGSIQVSGSDSHEEKTRNLLGFCRGDPLVLVSKPSIAGRGMNYQHCSNMAFVGLNDSFEQVFQAIRRCWRFGQTRPVNVYMVAAELEGSVVTNLKAKEERYECMADAMAVHMKDLCRSTIRGGRQSVSSYNAKKEMELPKWM